MTRRTSVQFLAAWLCLAFGSLASATEDITIIAQPNVTIGAGFGELTPGPHDLSITFQNNGAGMGYCYASASDASGSTIWSNDWSSPPTRPKLVCHGATEDMLGCVYASGYYMDMMNWSNSYMFGAAVANATFPCATLTCDPLNPMSCMYSMGCDPTREGKVEVIIGRTGSVSVTVRHGVPGTLTVTGGTGDLELLDGNGAPFTSVHLDGSGVDGVSLTLKASNMFSGQIELTAQFQNDNGPLDSQDKVTVKAKDCGQMKLVLGDKDSGGSGDTDADDPDDDGDGIPDNEDPDDDGDGINDDVDPDHVPNRHPCRCKPCSRNANGGNSGGGGSGSGGGGGTSAGDLRDGKLKIGQGYILNIVFEGAASGWVLVNDPAVKVCLGSTPLTGGGGSGSGTGSMSLSPASRRPLVPVPDSKFSGQTGGTVPGASPKVVVQVRPSPQPVTPRFTGRSPTPLNSTTSITATTPEAAPISAPIPIRLPIPNFSPNPTPAPTPPSGQTG